MSFDWFATFGSPREVFLGPARRPLSWRTELAVILEALVAIGSVPMLPVLLAYLFWKAWGARNPRLGAVKSSFSAGLLRFGRLGGASRQNGPGDGGALASSSRSMPSYCRLEVLQRWSRQAEVHPDDPPAVGHGHALLPVLVGVLLHSPGLRGADALATRVP